MSNNIECQKESDFINFNETTINKMDFIVKVYVNTSIKFYVLSKKNSSSLNSIFSLLISR